MDPDLWGFGNLVELQETATVSTSWRRMGPEEMKLRGLTLVKHGLGD